MENLNYVLIEGNLTRDPVQTMTTANCPLCRFTIANNRYFKSKNKPEGAEDTSYFIVEAWGKVADSCIMYRKKGQGVRVVGRLKQFTWKDESQGGKPRERVFIIAEHIQFQPKKAHSTETLAQEESGISATGEIQEDLNKYAIEEKEVESGEDK